MGLERMWMRSDEDESHVYRAARTNDTHPLPVHADFREYRGPSIKRAQRGPARAQRYRLHRFFLRK